MKAKIAYDYPYRLRVEHGDGASLRFERRGRSWSVDPAVAPDPADLVVVTGPTRVAGVLEGLRGGAAYEVYAPPEVLAWLARSGAVRPGPAEVDGIQLDSLAYPPPPPEKGNLRSRLASRVRGRSETAPGTAHAWQWTFPDGSRFLHLDLALHTATPHTWVDTALSRFGGPEWLLVGSAHGESVGVERHAPRFAARRVLVAELVNTDRAAAGLPTELVTPLRDRLVAMGLEAHVFATQTSYRFE